MNQDRADVRLSRLEVIARREYTALIDGQPENWQGGTLFLGKHYAAMPRGILMLGINPGTNGVKQDFHTGLYDENPLLPGASPTTLRYWRNARRLFGASDGLCAEMQGATYSFCSPFRTPNWNGLSPTTRQALIRHSRPILTRMMEDVDPRIVIVAGVAGEALFRALLTPELRPGELVSRSASAGGTYQWRAYAAAFGTSSLIVAQVPHLSRASSRKELERCGTWLADLVISREGGG
jgi:hypothetical protein